MVLMLLIAWWMAGWTDLLLHILTTRGSHVASLVKFCGLGGDSKMDGQTDRQWPFDPQEGQIGHSEK